MGKHRRTRHGRKAKQSGAAPVVPSTMVETVANNANANSTVQSDTTYPKSGGNTNTSMPNSNFDVTNPNSGGNTSTNAAMPAVGLDETVANAAGVSTTAVHCFEHYVPCAQTFHDFHVAIFNLNTESLFLLIR